MTDDEWAAWREARPHTTLLHLDSAAVGRSSTATLDAVVAHARLEAEAGGYVAEDRAADQLTALRHDLAGLLATDVEGVALVESAMAALAVLAHAWPLREGATVPEVIQAMEMASIPGGMATLHFAIDQLID